jgi:hypothetical protein
MLKCLLQHNDLTRQGKEPGMDRKMPKTGYEMQANRDISVKTGKDRVSTPSLVIHRVRFKKYLQKSTLAFKGGGETYKTIKKFHPVFLFS